MVLGKLLGIPRQNYFPNISPWLRFTTIDFGNLSFMRHQTFLNFSQIFWLFRISTKMNLV